MNTDNNFNSHYYYYATKTRDLSPIHPSPRVIWVVPSLAPPTHPYSHPPTSCRHLDWFRTNPPTHVHHRRASCTGENCCGCDPSCGYQNPNDITGALAGGPGAPDDYYNDDRGDYVMNEVALDYNDGFQVAIAG